MFIRGQLYQIVVQFKHSKDDKNGYVDAKHLF